MVSGEQSETVSQVLMANVSYKNKDDQYAVHNQENGEAQFM